MPRIPCNWQLQVLIIRQSSLISVNRGRNRSLEPIRHRLELWHRIYMLVLQPWLQWINVEEWIFPVIYLRSRRSINRLVTLVANSWDVEVDVTLGNLYPLELGVYHVLGILAVFELGWLDWSVFYSPKVALIILSYALSSKPILLRLRKSLIKLLIYRIPCHLGK